MKRVALIPLLVVVAFLSQLRSQGWVDVTPVSPGPTTQYSSMCYDPVRGVSWLFRRAGSSSNYYLNIFSWDGSSWTSHGTPSPVSPASQSTIESVWDPVNQVVVVATRTGNGVVLTTWDGTVSSSLGFKSTPSAPGLMAYDGARQEICLFLGASFWIWDGTNFQLAQSAVPPPGMNLNSNSMFYDATTQRVIVTRGASTFDEYWAWDGGNWSQHYPNPRFAYLGRVAEAPARGLSLAQTFWSHSIQPRTFAIANGEYTELFLTNWPAMRAEHHLVYDSGRDRFVLHGGSNYTDTWELDLGTTASFTTYGAGCAGSGGVPQVSATSGSVPAVNTQFSIQVSNLPWTGPCFMWLGFSNQSYGGLPLPVNLAILNAPQCDVLISPDILYGIPNVLGTSVWTLGIPNVPGFTFYNQAIGFDPAANQLGLVFSNASEAIVGQ